MIKENFKPISNEDTFASLFEENERTSTIYLRSRHPTNTNNKIDSSEESKMAEAELNNNFVLFEDVDIDSILVTVEEVSGRRILWDERNRKFDSVIHLKYPKAELPNLRVDAVLACILVRK